MQYAIWLLFLLTAASCKNDGKQNENEKENEAGIGGDILGELEGKSYRFGNGWRFALGDEKGAEAGDFDDAAWETVDLPHDWSIHLDFNEDSPAGGGGGYLDGGVGWYRKSFTLSDAQADKRAVIRFDGVYMNSEVWVNGEYLGVRPYGYIWFEYDMTEYLNYGETPNVIAVRVENNQPTSRWYSGSGIYRNVWLTLLDPVHIPHDGYYVSTPEVARRKAEVAVSTEVVNRGDSAVSVSLGTEIAGPDGKIVATGAGDPVSVGVGETIAVSQSLEVADPKRWSVTDPILYNARTKVMLDGKVVDTAETAFGIRTFRFEADTGFYLNDINMKLNGVCLHHDLGALGAAVNTRAIERRLEIMKAMGANAVRTAHNPEAPEFLDLCDRLGMLVIEEAFDAWQEGNKAENDYHLYFDDWAEADLRAMVRRDRNHPSIIMWSIGNEIHDIVPGGQFDGVATTAQLMGWVKEEDDRPVTMGSNYNLWAAEAVAQLDVVGYNYNTDWYDEQRADYPEWKMYASETSSAVRSRGAYHTPTDQNIMPKGEDDLDHQLSSYDNSVVDWGTSAERSWQLVNTRDFMAGEFIWTGFDYIGEPTPFGWPFEPGWPSKSSYFGIVDTAGFPKDIYYFYQSKWTEDPMVHLLPHWNWEDGDTVEVWAYTNARSVELFLNGTSLGELDYPADPLAPQHLVWHVPFESGTLRAEARNKEGEEVATHEIRTAGAPAKVELLPDRKVIRADGWDLVFVETNILDADDIFVPSADNMVEFEVEGPGRIVGVDNGNAASIEPYKGRSRNAFNGKCLVIIQSTGEIGDIAVTGSSTGLDPATATVAAK